jgi:methyl-accepting chemotaxis protein
METFLSFMPYFCIAYGAFYIGKHWALFQFSQNLSKDPDRMIEILNQIKNINTQVDEHDMPEDAIPMTIEEVNGQVYAYNQITGEFLAQAQNVYQAAVLAAARFPDKKFWHPSLKQDAQTA